MTGNVSYNIGMHELYHGENKLIFNERFTTLQENKVGNIVVVLIILMTHQDLTEQMLW
jgi:hypothetical protein